MDASALLHRIRAFGVRGQGVQGEVGGRRLRIFSADRIVNPHVLERFAGLPAGAEALSYEGRLLVRVPDGILRLREWELVDAATGPEARQ